MSSYITYAVKTHSVKIIDVRWISDNWCKSNFLKRAIICLDFLKPNAVWAKVFPVYRVFCENNNCISSLY